MNCVAEERINSIQGESALMQDTKKEIVKSKPRLKLNNDETKSSLTELFPWILEFRKMCRRIHMEKSMASLTELMQFYLRNVSVSVNECYTRPLRAAKLKEFISETLLLFLYIYRELFEDRDRSVYLNNMSDLLALYIDMELKASKKSKEDHDKICARLTSCLYVYLEHSIEHLLDTLIKIHFMCQSYHDILDPIITKIMKSIPTHPESSTMYIRYFFIYRLWRKINENAAVKSEITATAIASLGPLPSIFSPTTLADVLPKVPKSQRNSTKSLLQHKFDIKKHCEMFAKYCQESNGSVCRKDGSTPPTDSSSTSIAKMPEDTTSSTVQHLDKGNLIVSGKRNQNESSSLPKPLRSFNSKEQNSFKRLDTCSSNVSTDAASCDAESMKQSRNRTRRKCKKSKEIVIIDLTSDVALEKCIKKRNSRKLPWLEEAKRRVGSKMAKASRKRLKKEQVNISRGVDRRLEDSKNESSTDESKMEIDREEVVGREEDTRVSMGMEVDGKEESVEASEATSKPVSSEILLSEEQVSSTMDTVVDDNCSPNGDVSDGKENNRFAKQTVIKRLIETEEAVSESEQVETFPKACDLKAEYPMVNSSSNLSNADAITNTEITECIASLEISVDHERNGRNVSNDVCFDEAARRPECYASVTNSNAYRETCPARDAVEFEANEENIEAGVESKSSETGSHLNASESLEENASTSEPCSMDERNMSGTIGAARRNDDSCDSVDTNLGKAMEDDRAAEYIGKGSPEAASKEEGKFIVQDSELQDNIDGLSLLASVSQHVPHLKPDCEAKYDQIKVKDYASLRHARYNRAGEEDDEAIDTVSQLLENPSSEMINRIVGIYPEGSLDKVALRLEVTCSDASHSEGSANYDADGLSHSFATAECNAQASKENTNVILNGETVVLLQKSPNSNLYIINKAVENDEETSRLKEKNWISLSEECGQFEAVASLDHAELTLYGKELPYPESKRSVARGKGIKVEPEAENFPEPLSVVPSQMYPDVGAMSNKSMDKRKSPKSSLAYRASIKQEFSSISSHIAATCAIPGCNGIHSHPHEVDGQHHPLTTLPSIYGNCAGNAELCVPYHKHCTQVSCGAPLHTRAKPTSPCGRSRCSCLNCTYDIVAHCRQCMHPATDSHVSCIESSPYFLPTHSSVQGSAAQEHDMGKKDPVMGKLYDDRLLCKIEKSLLQSSSLEKLDAQGETGKMYSKDAENKLPLKKRLKAHALAYELPIKTEQADNYPAMPMMSIAALEVLDSAPKRSGQAVKSEYEPGKMSESHTDSYRYSSSLVRRDYYKDAAGSLQSISKESTRKVERQFRSNEQTCNAKSAYQESCLRRTVKTAAQRKEMSGAELKQFETMEYPAEEEGACKKMKKTQSPPRQTRSSKRNVPKVNYSYTDVDPEWNPSGESKRKRRKTSR